MRKFIRNSLLFLSPFLLILIFIVAIYIYCDPFKVIYHYKAFLKPVDTFHVFWDKDYVSTENFVNNYPAFQYDSYIFGNSRAQHYRMADWAKYLNEPKCYHFDASSESLFGIERKLNFLHNQNVKIKNALFVVDASVFSVVTNSTGTLFIKDPRTSGESKIVFQSEFLKAFLKKEFFLSYIDFKLSKHFKPYMGSVLSNYPVRYNATTNEVSFPEIDQEINADPVKYYSSKIAFYDTFKRGPVQRYDSPSIGLKQKELLLHIKQILESNHTNCRFVINPKYDQLKLNSADLEYLQSVFGRENIFDFSGINEITQDYHNYYDVDSHYRPFVAAKMMSIAYTYKNNT